MSDNAKRMPDVNKKLYTTIMVVVLIISIGAIGYMQGYRFKSNWTIGKVGIVTLEIPLPLTSIFIDESKKITTSKDNEVVKLSFSPRKHSIIVSRDGYFPWKKDFEVSSGSELNFIPIFVSQNATGEIITKNDPEYLKLKREVSVNKLPSENSPKISEDQKESLWVEDNAVYVGNLNEKKLVINPDTLIRNVDFYKNRSDVLIISTGNSVYAIEVDKSGQQNFMPIYRGTNPLFMKTDNNFIYVLDGETLMQVII